MKVVVQLPTHGRVVMQWAGANGQAYGVGRNIEMQISGDKLVGFQPTKTGHVYAFFTPEAVDFSRGWSETDSTATGIWSFHFQIGMFHHRGPVAIPPVLKNSPLILLSIQIFIRRELIYLAYKQQKWILVIGHSTIPYFVPMRNDLNPWFTPAK